MQATKDQKFTIRKNCQYKTDVKEEWVQWATNDNSKTSLNDLTFDQANKIIQQQTGKTPQPTKQVCWGKFDKTNPQHKVIMSLLYQAQWTQPSDKYGEIPDIDRLGEFLKSDKSPVKKPLLKMETHELQKVITALSGIVKSKFK